MRVRSLHTVALGAAIAVLAVVAPAARTEAAASSACTTTSGVTVIVDFSHFGGTIIRGCAPGPPPTALAAMHAAGFATAGTTRYGDAFLCRIDSRPKPKDEACGDTPPANSSWSFYWAKAGDAAWTYSRTGVLSNHPAAGSIIAFAFGNYAKPGILPAAAIPAAPPTTAATTPPTPAPASPPVTALTAPTTSAVVTTTESTSTTSPRSTTTSATTSTPAASTTSTGVHIVDRATGNISHDDSGSPLPALLAAALVVALGIGTGFTIRARRRRSA